MNSKQTIKKWLELPPHREIGRGLHVLPMSVWVSSHSQNTCGLGEFETQNRMNWIQWINR